MIFRGLQIMLTWPLSYRCNAFSTSLSSHSIDSPTSLYFQKRTEADSWYDEQAKNTEEVVSPASFVLPPELTYSWDREVTYEELYEDEEEVQGFEADLGSEHGDDETTEGYYEDGTPFETLNPSLELLKEWTEEYIDAVDLAGGFITRVSVGVEMLLADEYVYTSPSIGPINKIDFVKLMKYYNDNGMDLASAIPDLKVSYEGWHQDPHEPWRIWAIARYSGTHFGTVTIPGSGLQLMPPNQDCEHPFKFTSGPELHSFLWTADKKILWQTMGYVGDTYTGSNKGVGGLDGVLVSLGLPHVYPEAIAPMRDVSGWLARFREDSPCMKSRHSHLPLWWHERKSYDMNIRR